MNLIKCFMKNSTWFKEANRGSKPVGILWHDTGAGNPTIKRYVQPFENDSNYDELISIIGKNKYGNDWNHIVYRSGVHAWIGKLADGNIATVQVGDWDITPWGNGSGKYGSCNGYTGNFDWQGIHWIQFEICDDGYGNKEYLDKVYEEACELTAYLCKEFDIDPNGTVLFNGVTIPTILCHADSYRLGVGNNHADVISWFSKYGYSMDTVRKDVWELIKNESNIGSGKQQTFDLLDVVKIKDGVTTYYNGVTIPTWVRNSNLYVRDFKSNRVTISTVAEGAITGIVYSDDLTLIRKNINENLNNVTDSKQTGDIVSNISDPSKNVVTEDSSVENTLTDEEKQELGNKFVEFINCILSLILKLFKRK